MTWFRYVLKTSLKQIVRDYKNFKSLNVQLWQAERDLEYSVQLVTRKYDVEDDINYGNACLKHKKIIDAVSLFDETSCRYTLSRCKFFEPIDDEKLCPNHMCECWPNNNRFCRDLGQVKELQQQVSDYWKNKFMNLK